MSQKSIFEDFTNLYQLSKTLRFELKPVGKTLENMKHQLKYDPELQTFFKDQEIEDAYQVLKPVFDKLHEEFITRSLSSENAKNLDFSLYFENYKNKGKLKNENFKKEEKKLRETFNSFYNEAAKKLKNDAGKDEKGKDILKKEGVAVLTEVGILNYIECNKEKFKEILSEEDLKKRLLVFKNFFGYLDGFNQNRKNYYTTKDEKATAVATRIVHENLPKFCDNILIFESQKDTYLEVYAFLKNIGRDLVDRNGHILDSITENIFLISYFNNCFTQEEIENYNAKIGDANYLINLYNQAKRQEKDFRKLSEFKTLYKQIGCGGKASLFFSLTDERKTEADKKRKEGKEAYSVEEILTLAINAGQKYFKKNTVNNDNARTVYDLLDYIRTKEDYAGIYWSRAAVNTISNRYFANWYFILERLKDRKELASYDKKREEQIKINELVELAGLFDVLDSSAGEDWRQEGAFFKSGLTSLLDENNNNKKENEKIEKRRKIIAEVKNPSRALLEFIFADIEDNMENFLDKSNKVENLKSYSDEFGKKVIKEWMDHSLTVNQILKYFLVKEGKIKGNPLDAEVSNMLKELLFEDSVEVDEKEIMVEWFKWYDALRNYLTKKPQDDAKENKLKLNFENSKLLGGWSDGQEKAKGAVLLKKGGLYYLGILKKRNIFENKEKMKSEVYRNSDEKTSRLVLKNLKFQTLAGKGFLGKYGMSYGKMGKDDPQGAINCLQTIIKERYLSKYPLLESVANVTYTDKKIFDSDIQKLLKECYDCKFLPVNWEKVNEYIINGDMYLFQIYSKDILDDSKGKKDLQTIYWKMIFEKDSPLQLNGGGEVFYRKKSVDKKKVKSGYEHKPWIIESKRFTENEELTKQKEVSKSDGKSFFFHCPIKFNYKQKKYSAPKYAFPEINKIINNNFLGSSKYFLGIDRGEKHLAYYSLVDEDGAIKEQGTLNLPFLDKDGKPRSIKKEKYFWNRNKKEWEKKMIDCWNYNDLLDAIASNRDMARKNWQTIGTIKEVKSGYISQAIRKVADLAVEQGAFIILEDLNTGFKRGRQKIEKSVYQKFELALAKKLNFLVNKDAKVGELASVTNALQLTPPVSNYGDIENKKQSGIMLYTRANYTSQTDPLTGWRKCIYLKSGSEENIKDQIIGNEEKKIKASFSEIMFDGKDYVFVYRDNNGKEWKLYSGKNGKSLDRFRGKRGLDKNEWMIEKIDIVQILDGIFSDYDKTQSLFSQMKNGKALIKIGDKHTAWESLRFVIDLIQQIRNTGEEERDNDFILSPVRDDDGNHFDSRLYWDKEKKGENVDMPSSGDANGAYNIARKGIIMKEHLKRRSSLYVTDGEWDAWLAGKEIWEKWIDENEKNVRKK